MRVRVKDFAPSLSLPRFAGEGTPTESLVLYIHSGPLSCEAGEAAPSHPCARAICTSCAAGWGGGNLRSRFQ
jgi:hypothetical protein